MEIGKRRSSPALACLPLPMPVVIGTLVALTAHGKHAMQRLRTKAAGSRTHASGRKQSFGPRPLAVRASLVRGTPVVGRDALSGAASAAPMAASLPRALAGPTHRRP
jgi:hypothetical protein